MSITSIKLKTHSREDITEQCGILNYCIVHHCKPKIFKMVVGKRKEVYYIANCKSDECGKISDEADKIVGIWNKWNPNNQTQK